MIVVSDSSPLILLSKLHRLAILPALFGTVIIPPDVQHEIQAQSHRDTSMRPFVEESNSWLIVQSPTLIASHKGLHAGETAAIALAKECRADALLIDEKAGRRAALREGVRIIGTIGVLEMAAEVGLLDLASTFDELKQTDFRIAPQFLDFRLEVFKRRYAYRDTPPSTESH